MTPIRHLLRRSLGIAPMVALLVAIPAGAQEGSPAAGEEEETREDATVRTTSCVACHSDEDWFPDGHIEEIVHDFRGDAHDAAEISCHDCHGGDPDPALSQDIDAAMDSTLEDNPFIGVPSAQEIPTFCGRCHSDPTFMRQYQPDPRIDQVREYLTSHHGRALLQEGDTNVATCVDCHGTHGILDAKDPRSPIFPTNVAETCRRCHGDADTMAGYTTQTGAPMPIDQYARWTQSVHASAMFEKEDLTAPTCNDCHGNHGATPPGVESIGFVCGQCHGREAGLFRSSAKRTGFENHNSYIEGMGPDACSACHGEPEPQATFTGVAEFSECSTCHRNHAIVRPSVAMLSPLPEIPCAFCHEGSGPLAGESPPVEDVPPEPVAVQRNYTDVRDDLLARAEEQGLEGIALFDWMVDRALEVDAHHRPSDGGGTQANDPEAAPEASATEGAPLPGAVRLPDTLRPEFENLFYKFRIGKSYFTFNDPESGETVRAPVRRCSDCHAEEPVLVDEAAGWETGERFLAGMNELTALTARAERIMLAAKRGGVHTEEASLAIDRAVDAQIQLEVLVHTFDASEGSDFAERHAEGIEQAKSALDRAQAALDELEYRRSGLVISLVVILLVLVALGLKIRQVAR